MARGRCGVRYVWGDHDLFGSVDAAKWAADVTPNAELHLMPGGGHNPWWDDAEASARLVREAADAM